MPDYNYEFRIIIETEDSQKYAYGTSSLVSMDANMSKVVTTEDIVNSINTMPSMSYYNAPAFMTSSGIYNEDSPKSNPAAKTQIQIGPLGGIQITYHSQSFGETAYPHYDTDYQFISCSIKDHNLSGSILFHTNTEKAPDGNYLKRYKFWGNKVCQVLGLPENYWIYSDKFRLSNTGSETNYLTGDVLASSMNIKSNFAINNAGSITSDLPFRHFREADRYARWTDISSSIPQNKMLVGYNQHRDEYGIEMPNDAYGLIISASAVTMSGDLKVIGDVIGMEDDSGNPTSLALGGVAGISVAGALTGSTGLYVTQSNDASHFNRIDGDIRYKLGKNSFGNGHHYWYNQNDTLVASLSDQSGVSGDGEFNIKGSGGGNVVLKGDRGVLLEDGNIQLGYSDSAPSNLAGLVIKTISGSSNLSGNFAYNCGLFTMYNGTGSISIQSHTGNVFSMGVIRKSQTLGIGAVGQVDEMPDHNYPVQINRSAVENQTPVSGTLHMPAYTTASFYGKVSVGGLASGNKFTHGNLLVKTDPYGHAITITEPGIHDERWNIGVDSDGDLNFYNSNAFTDPLFSLKDTNTASFDGCVRIDTDSNTTPFVISRNATSLEAVSIGVDDTNVYHKYYNDEKSSRIRFQMWNTDTEAGDGDENNGEPLTLVQGDMNGTDYASRVGVNTTTPTKTLTVGGQISSSGAITIGPTSPGEDVGIKWRVFTGTLSEDGASETQITHGITNGTKRIVGVTMNVYSKENNVPGNAAIGDMLVIPTWNNIDADAETQIYYDDTNIYVYMDSYADAVGGQRYTMMVHYTNADLY